MKNHRSVILDTMKALATYIYIYILYTCVVSDYYNKWVPREWLFECGGKNITTKIVMTGMYIYLIRLVVPISSIVRFTMIVTDFSLNIMASLLNTDYVYMYEVAIYICS